MTDVTIYHNSRCSKSRQTLALLEENGVRPKVIEYLKDTPTEKELSAVIKKLGISADALIRKNEDEWKQHGAKLDDPSDADLVALMVKYPKLIQRPIVVKGQQAALGRPPEDTLKIL